MVVRGAIPAAGDGADVRAWVVVDPVAAGDELRVVLQPNPMLRVRGVDESGAAARFTETTIVALETDGNRSPLSGRDGWLLTLALVGPPPWRVVVRESWGTSLRFSIDSAPGDVERTIVFGKQQWRLR